MLFSAFPATALADEGVPYTPHRITSSDGVTLSVQEWGNPEGPAILFIHGFSQTHLNWTKQVRDPVLADEFRMVTFDLRGHGMSDKPEGTAHYREGERWADDLAAIIESLDLSDPVLVASSMGGRVVGDYVAHHGDEAISGFKAVGALLMDDASQWFGPALRHMERMVSTDIATAIDGTKRFIEELFVIRPPEDRIRTMIGYNMMTPRHVRIALGGRATDHDGHWRELKVPVLLSHGREDRVIALGMSKSAAELMAHATTSFMEGIGHAPFVEAPDRFNAELAAFVRNARNK